MPTAQAMPRTYAPVDITPFRSESDPNPLLLAIRTFGQREGAFPEGLRSESVIVNYQKTGSKALPSMAAFIYVFL